MIFILLLFHEAVTLTARRPPVNLHEHFNLTSTRISKSWSIIETVAI